MNKELMNQIFYGLSLLVLGVALVAIDDINGSLPLFIVWALVTIAFTAKQVISYVLPYINDYQPPLAEQFIEHVSSPVAQSIAHQITYEMTLEQIEELSKNYLDQSGIWAKSAQLQ